MISFEEASKIIENTFRQLKPDTEIIPFENALHRTLAEDVFADIDLPPFDNSAMDGIAIKFDENIKEWKIVGEIAAGKFSSFNLDANSAVSIMTGSRLPDFCDTVIPIEDIELVGNFANLKSNVILKKGINIRKKGSDLRKESIAIPENTYLLPKHLATAASCGYAKLNVLKKLKVGVIATGDELIPVGKKPEGDKIRISNSYSLLSSVAELNMIPVNLGVVKDDKNLLKKSIKTALDDKLDILITTGGVSVGKFDYVKDVFEGLGVEIKFWKAYIKPGKPVVFGIYDKSERFTLVFGLPGNPVSSLVNFEIFIRENINQLFHQPKRGRVKAILKNDLKKKDKKRHFMRGILSKVDNENYEVSSQFSQSSGNLVEMSRANCLIVIEEEILNPKKGMTVECIMI